MPESNKKNHKLTFYVNNQPFETTEHELTGAAIKALARIPADYELFEVQGSETIPVGDNQVVRIHEKLHFRAIPPGTFGHKWGSHLS